MFRPDRRTILVLSGFLILLDLAALVDQTGVARLPIPPSTSQSARAASPDRVQEVNHAYLPLITKPAVIKPRINVPHFDGDVLFSESAIFWFGEVTPTGNYADIRVGYNDEIIKLSVHIFDRSLWTNSAPEIGELTGWDAVSLFLDLSGKPSDVPTLSSHRLIVQLNPQKVPDIYQAAYRGSGSGWEKAETLFMANTGWRGDGYNDSEKEARGWHAVFEIPFTSLGLQGPPGDGDIWNLGVVVHDRDDAVGSPIADQSWPPAFDAGHPSTWAQLHFGLPEYTRPDLPISETIIVRQGLNGADVVDAHVGGHTVCGQPYWPDGFFTAWGKANYAGYQEINIQDQWDVADFPCFSKYYITFPLEGLPSGKQVISATLTMQQFGNAGQGYQPGPKPSLIQVFAIGESWSEAIISWNNAPLVMENVSSAWVDPIGEGEEWPQSREWDLSRAVAEAYEGGGPLRLALYSADTAQHSGKYFYSSDLGDWGADWRPTLEVRLGEP